MYAMERMAIKEVKPRAETRFKKHRGNITPMVSATYAEGSGSGRTTIIIIIIYYLLFIIYYTQDWVHSQRE